MFFGNKKFFEPRINNDNLKLTNEVFWDFFREPHLLVSGRIGSGKTELLKMLSLLLASQYRVEVFTLYPQEWEDLSSLNIVKSVDNLLLNMERYLEVYEKSYSVIKPSFIVIDNLDELFLSYFYEYRERSQFERLFKRLILSARKTGIFFIVSTFRADFESFSPKMRDNFSKRISLGVHNSFDYDMLFSCSSAEVEIVRRCLRTQSLKKGTGFIGTFGESPKRFEFSSRGFRFF